MPADGRARPGTPPPPPAVVDQAEEPVNVIVEPTSPPGPWNMHEGPDSHEQDYNDAREPDGPPTPWNQHHRDGGGSEVISPTPGGRGPSGRSPDTPDPRLPSGRAAPGTYNGGGFNLIGPPEHVLIGGPPEPSMPARRWVNGYTQEKLASAAGGGTALGFTPPVVYGSARVKGALAVTERVDEMLTLVWVFCSGKCAAPGLADVLINKEYLNTANWSTRLNDWDSSGGDVTPSVLSVLTTLGSGYGLKYPGQVLFGLDIDTRETDIPSLNAELDCDGRYILDFRTSTSGYYNNPVLVAYDILTANWPWPGVLTSSDFDISEWEDWADWCDETSVTRYDYSTDAAMTPVSITDKKWEFNGIVNDTNPWTAADSVLETAHLQLIELDGKFRLLPQCDQAPTSVYIPEGRFYGTPVIDDVDPKTVPTELEVRYISKADHSECTMSMTRSATGNNLVSLVAFGCNSQRQVARWAEQKAKLLEERLHVSFETGPEVADVAAGDIIEAHLPHGFGDQYIRVMSVVSRLSLGMYKIDGRIINGSVESIISETARTAKTPSGGWETGTPDPPTWAATPSVDIKNTSRDVSGPVVKLSWNPPEEGPRVKFYEVRQDSTIIARVYGTKWSGPVMEIDSSASFKVVSVSYSGLESTALSYTLNVNSGLVTSIQTVSVEGGLNSEAGLYGYDDTVNPIVLTQLVKREHIEPCWATITNGNSSIFVYPGASGGDVIAAVVVPWTGYLGTAPPAHQYWVETVAGGANYFVIRRVGTSGAMNFFCLAAIDVPDLDSYSNPSTDTPPATS